MNLHNETTFPLTYNKLARRQQPSFSPVQKNRMKSLSHVFCKGELKHLKVHVSGYVFVGKAVTGNK